MNAIFKLFVWPWIRGIFGLFAVVQLADAIIPTVYQSYDSVDDPTLTAFVQSGVAISNEAINANARSGGKLVHLPFWKDLDFTIEPNYTTDNIGDLATPNKIQADEMVARVAQMNQAYQAADLVTELAGSNPMQRIRNRFAAYWAHVFQTRILAATVGIFNNNVVNNNADMVNDISTADGVNAVDANLFSRKAFVNAIFTLGDHFGNIAAIAVHSLVFARMVNNDDITFIAPSTPDPRLPLDQQQQPYFLGKRVIVDDQMPVIAGGVSGFRFVSVLFGTAAFGYGQGTPSNPMELFRNPNQGNGGGIEQIWERKTWVVHPFGHKWNDVTVTGNYSPNNSDLQLATNWTRKIQRKKVPVAFLVTNG
jgi:hypothetical protein